MNKVLQCAIVCAEGMVFDSLNSVSSLKIYDVYELLLLVLQSIFLFRVAAITAAFRDMQIKPA